MAKGVAMHLGMRSAQRAGKSRCKCGATNYPKLEDLTAYWCPTCGRGTESHRDRIARIAAALRKPGRP